MSSVSFVPPPPFLSAYGDEETPFFALAYIPGTYKQTRGDVPASLGLYLCLHPEFSRFSLHTHDAGQKLKMYHRIEPPFDTLEGAFLATWQDGVEPVWWRLFPLESVVINDEDQKAEYQRVRQRLCFLLSSIRLHAGLKGQLSPQTKFVVNTQLSVPTLGDNRAEDEEITAAVMALYQDV